jgi:CRP-like cAMP-binding protein/predicted MFS family arabinose efflux permease
MRERLRVVVAVARDPVLARIELAFLGFNMTEYATWIAILVWAYGIGGAGAAGIVALVQLIPAGLVAPFGAYAGDRFRRDRVLLAGYLVQAAAVGATAVALYADAPVAVTLVFATVAAASFTITRPTQAAILPAITHAPQELTAANAVSGLAENIGILVGPFLGGLLLIRSEPGDVFAAFAVVTLVSALLVVRLPIDPAAASPRERLDAGDVLRGSLAGFGVLRRERRVALLVLVLSATIVVAGALDVLVVAVAIDLLGAGEAWAGFLYSAFGLGGIIGALGAVALVGRRRLTPSLAGGDLLLGVPIAAIGLLPVAATAPAFLAASGAGYSVGTIAGRTLLQRIAPEAALARVFGILEGLAMFALALGSIGSAALVESLGIGAALVVTGLFVPVVLALTWIPLRALDRAAKAPDPEALALLRRIPIFAPLSAPAIERIMAGLVRLEVPAGHVLIREGDEGDRFYVIAEGTVAVSQGGRHIADRFAGDHVGEIALLRGVPRTATVTAVTPLRLLALDRGAFLEAVTGHPQSREHAEAVAQERLANDASASGGRHLSSGGAPAPTSDAQRESRVEQCDAHIM